MRAIAGLAAALVAAAVVGCGNRAVSPAQHVADTVSPAQHVTDNDPLPKIPHNLPVRCVHLRPVLSQRTVSLTDADNHKTFCVRRGTGIFVFLHSPTSRPWSPIQSSSSVLSRRPSGVMSLVRGETGAYYVAAGLGHATLTSGVSRCPNGPHAGSRCLVPLEFSVTVYVQA
jgi:hypothetical protein